MTADDLEYVFGRLDPLHYEPLAAQARAAWEFEVAFSEVETRGSAAFELCYQPGDGTHYALVFAPVTWPVFGAPGGGTGGGEPGSGSGVYPRDGRHALATYLQRGTSMIFGLDEFVHPTRVAEGLGPNPASALAIAVLLNEITMPGDRRWRDSMIENAKAEAVTPA